MPNSTTTNSASARQDAFRVEQEDLSFGMEAAFGASLAANAVLMTTTAGAGASAVPARGRRAGLMPTPPACAART